MEEPYVVYKSDFIDACVRGGNRSGLRYDIDYGAPA